MARFISSQGEIGSIMLKESAAPAAPAAGYFQVYAKVDNKLYCKNDAGTEICLSDTVATDPIWDAAGDLAVGSGANTSSKLSIGTAHQLLKVDSGATGLEWGPTLTSWTPTITQNVGVTCTVTYAKYCRIGPLMYICANLAVTSAGTAGNDIQIGNLPANPAANGVYGTGWINDSGTGYYSGDAIYVTANYFKFRAHLEADDIGTDPNFALANSDAIMFFALYPV